MTSWTWGRRGGRPGTPGLSPAQRTPRLPYPDGWFALAATAELDRGVVLTRRLMGEDVVLYRTASGRPCAVRPFCPHLGAHLGHGGTVHGEDIVCPFHHFRFDPEGSCVRTGYGTAAPKARLSTLECREVDGLVFLWRHAQGVAPTWEIEPAPPADFPAPYCSLRRLVEHPQDVVENIVDFGHFSPVHGTTAEVVEEPRFDGARMETTFRIHAGAGRRSALVSSTAPLVRTVVEGLGAIYSEVESERPGFRLRVRLCPTPVDPVRVEMRMSTTARFTTARGGRAARALAALALRPLAWAAWHDMGKDFPIWEHKTYLERPRLAAGDGPIMKYRRWARQFYSPAPTA
ncbi:Rieske (2Fe-2S) protein [Streptomyces sp. LX-29]|uniref:Rieske 2Fe-2S domain-containing protein n=1 Tax=Streptomyces sp. LX-29 TaxID=2900152 RepID=UPI00240D4763|nr:Rieske 2Fe-2S domain-containing protein [Streptomyces sp. LX-29]WFB05990.1 Rieske (2Fe-2S) protein [Streptomyces sp. LX-29]